MSLKVQEVQFINEDRRTERAGRTKENGFERIYAETIKSRGSTVKISAHAADRMRTRNIKISEERMTRIQDALGVLEKKGARESLFICKDAAFIINIGNKTIITAMRNEEMETITNIDSAVQIK